jgi:hypothetical protein
VLDPRPALADGVQDWLGTGAINVRPAHPNLVSALGAETSYEIVGIYLSNNEWV